MKIAVGSDHAGFELKQELAEALRQAGHEVLDVGTDSARRPSTTRTSPRRWAGPCCDGTGRARRAHLRQRRRAPRWPPTSSPASGPRICHDTYSAHQGVEHDDMNVLVLGGRVVGTALARELVDAFLDARFTARSGTCGGCEPRLAEGARAPDGEGPGRARCDPRRSQYGQSVWLDFIRRSLITSGELKRLVEEDGLRGVTSNPAIFEKAIAGSDDYADVHRGDRQGAASSTPRRVYETLAIKDIQDAADVLRPVYDRHGAARRLRQPGGLARPRARHRRARSTKRAACGSAVDRAERDDQGARRRRRASPRSATLISEGINVNVTLLFAQRGLRARRRGLHRRPRGARRRGGDRRRVASVASFFVSRIDTRGRRAARGEAARRPRGADKARLAALLRQGRHRQRQARLPALQEDLRRPALEALAAKGAQTQRVLWASTGTKNPQLPRRALRRGADRPRHRQHRAARDARRLPRPRPAARRASRRTSTSAMRRRSTTLEKAGISLEQGRPTSCWPTASRSSSSRSRSC